MTPDDENQRILDVHERDGVTIVRFTPYAARDGSAAGRIAEELSSLAGGPRKVVLDFTGVRVFPSNCLGALIALHRSLHEEGGALRLCCLPPGVHDILEFTMLDRRLDIRETERQALDGL